LAISYLQEVLPSAVKNRPGCADLFTGLGVSFDAFMAKISNAVALDGTTSRASYNAYMLGHGGRGRNDQTVSQVFSDPSVTAKSSWRYNEIYFRPAYLTPETLAHEVFHKMLSSSTGNYLWDDDLMEFLKGSPFTSPQFNPNGKSEEFSKEFKRRCLD